MVVQSIGLVTDLRIQNKNIGVLYLATGNISEGDNNGGTFWWNPTSTASDDGVSVIQVTGVATGRWIRIADYKSYVPTYRTINTTSPLIGGGSLLSDLTLSMPSANSITNGYLTSADWIIFNSKQGAITLTTTGTTGASTLIGNILNIPNYTTDLSGYVPTSRTITINGVTFDLSANRSWTIDALPSQTGNGGKYLTTNGTIASWASVTTGTVTSVGLSMPVAFNVTNSPVTTSGTLTVTGAGTAAQYIRGDGQLATLPSGGGGGASVNYYLNGGTNQGTFGGSIYYEMNKSAIVGIGVDFSLAGNGLISQWITDAGDPNSILIPGGNWNFEMYFSASSGGGTPAYYVELLKYSGTTFTSIASSVGTPEAITGGTAIDLYLTSLAVPETILLSTDRIAIRVYIVNSVIGRTITNHTQDSHLCQITTTFASGISALNGLTANTQYFATGTTGTDFNISSATDTHTFNLPTSSATNRGALSSADWTTFNGKLTLPSLTSGSILFSNGTTIAQDNANLFWDDTNNRLGISTITPSVKLHIVETTANIETFKVESNITGTTIGNMQGITIQNNGGLNTFGGFIFRDGTAFAQAGFGFQNMNNTSHYGDIVFATRNSTGFGERMRLTYSGRLLLGTTTESTYILDAVGTTRFLGSSTFGTLGTGTGMFWDNTNNRLGIGINAPATSLQINLSNTNFTNTNGAGSHIYMTNPSTTGQNVISSFINGSLVAKWRTDYVGNISWVAGSTGAHDFYTGGDYAVGSAKLRIFNNGNVQISTSPVGGSNADTGYKLDVSGTGRFQDNLLVSKNQNSNTSILLSNTTSGTTSEVNFQATSDAAAGTVQFGKYSTLKTAYKIVSGKDCYFYNNSVAGDISFLNDFVTGKIKFAAGGSSTAQATLTAAGRLLLGTVTEGIYLLDVAGTGRFTGDLTTNTTLGSIFFAGTGGILSQNNANLFWDNTNQRLGIGTATPSAILHSVGTVNSASLIGRGAYFNNTIAATANNDVLIGLDINPTFTNGAFTGVTNTALKVTGTASISSSLTANSLIKSGGTSAQFLKADGSVDSTTYGTFILPSLTSGSVLFSNGTTISQDNANFFWDNTNKRLGIGTVSPVTDLVIKKSAGSGGFVGGRFENTSTTGSTSIAVYNNASEYGALEIFGSTYSGVTQRNLASFTSSATNGFSIICYNSSSTANFKISTGLTQVERFRLFNNTGNVVIQSGGTFTDAGYKLDTFGTVRFTSPSANPVLNLRASDAGNAMLSILGGQTGDVDWLIMGGYPAAGDFSIRQSSVVTALTIKKTSGIVLIGRTTAFASELLQVGSNIRAVDSALIGGGTNASALITSGYLVNGTNNTPILNLDGTWNSLTANPTAILLNITNTASGSSSKLIDLQISGVSKFKVDVNGALTSALITETRIDTRSISTASTATLTPDVSVDDLFIVTDEAVALTVAAPIGTPLEGQKIIIRIKDNGVATRAITWNSIYRASSDLGLPSATTLGKTMYLGFIYNTAVTKWDLIAYLNNF